MGEIEIKQLETLKTQLDAFALSYGVFFGNITEVEETKKQLFNLSEDLYKERILVIIEEPFWCPHCDEDEGYEERVPASVHTSHNEYHSYEEEKIRYDVDEKPTFVCKGCEEEIKWELIRKHKERYEQARHEFKKLEIIPKHMSFWGRLGRGKSK